jgi:hypothetical protein
VSTFPQPSHPPPDGKPQLQIVRSDCTTPEDLYAVGRSILEAPDLLALVRDHARSVGYAGDTAAIELTYLAVHSRHREQPLNVAVTGQSSAGKSYAVDIALNLHPVGAVHRQTASSEKALIFSNEDFRNRYIFVAESTGLHDDGVGATIIRELAWGGRGISYDTTEKGDDGSFRGRRIERPGPTGLITTSTKKLEGELSTRILRVPVDESPEQTRAIMQAVAEAAAHGDRDAEPTPDVSKWHAAARWLEMAGERRVVVPFAPDLQAAMPDDVVRIRRDFQQVLTVIRIHAFIHQRNRDRTERGEVIADRRDYEGAYRLLAPVVEVTLDPKADPLMRETVEAVERLLADETHDTVDLTAITRELGRSKATVSARVEKAKKVDYLVDLEDRAGLPARIKLGKRKLSRSVLPSTIALFGT